MRFSILGPLLVHDAFGRPITIGGARLRALLVLLLLRPGQRVTTDQLTDAIWAQGPPASAGNALQALVSRLRRVLGEGVRINGDASGYRLVIDPQQVDLGEFETLAKRGRAQLAAGEPAAAAASLGEALALWRGPALPDLTARGVAEDTALRLSETHRALTEDHLTALLDLGRTNDVLPEAEALVQREPHREHPVELLMRALAASGRTADAFATYDRFRSRLADETGLDPSPRLQDVHLRLLRGEFSAPGRSVPGYSTPGASAVPGRFASAPEPDATPPAVPSAETPAPHVRLPSTLTSFIPREAEVDTAVDLLTGARLVTLLGPGGAGKTRLAIETTSALVSREPHLLTRGGWFVELAPISADADILDALTTALDLREHAMLQTRSSGSVSTLEERVAAFLGDQPALLVLDNCEHLVADVARVVEPLLAQCPALRVLATSREPLGVAGERLLSVPSLAMPPADATAEQAADYASAVLFTERARAVRPDFAVTPDNVEHVVRITRALDGMPLALELAAARLRSMTPAQLADRLSDRFRILTGGSRSARARHRTLRAVVDWSWELLDEPERRLLRRLSIFAGGVTLDAVEHVCSDPGEEGTVDGRDVWTALFALVDKSLVIPDNPVRDDAPPRYRQLETVRAYAAERLTESGEEESVRDLHARHVRDLWREGDPMLRGPRQAEWLTRLGAEADNFGIAVRWAVTSRDVDLALDLVEYTQWYWTLDGGWRKIGRWSGDVLEMVGHRVPRGRALAYASCLFHRAADATADHMVILERIRQVEGVLQSAGERAETHPMLVYGLVYESMVEGGGGRVRDRLERAADQRDPWMRAMVRLLLSLLDGVSGNAEKALDRATAALEAFRACGDTWGECQALVQVVDVHRFDDLERCRQLLSEGIRMAEGAGLTAMAMMFRIRRTQVLVDLGDLEAAGHDLRVMAERGAPTEDEHVALVGMTEAQWLRESGELERARAVVDGLGPVVKRLGGFAPVCIEPAWLVMSATVAWTSGDAERAWRDTGRAWWLARRGLSPVGAEVLDVLAGIVVEDDPRRAAVLLGYAEALRGVPDVATPLVRRARARARRELGATEYTRLVGEAGGERPERIHEAVREWLAPIVPDDDIRRGNWFA